MLPNHTPLTIAEQFGTLESLHPGRIDLGLGRAPGSDQNTMRALRRDPSSPDAFPQDIKELQGFLSGHSLVPGVKAIPGEGTNVPLYILGSSLYGATLAAALGLPFAFASHFAPDALEEAVAIYRRTFRSSEQLDAPWVIAGVSVIAADSEANAQAQFIDARRRRVSHFLGRDRALSVEEVDQILESPQGHQLRAMTKYSAVGTPPQVKEYLDQFAAHADADELIVVNQSPSLEARLRSVELLADVSGLIAA
jgi:luciferase family oxidoreductase group 1